MSDEDPLADIRESFFVECEELLESLNDSLLAMDEGESDSETINTVFRAVHSIKGGAGAFGLDRLVEFAHAFETVLDLFRAGDLNPGPENIRLSFAAADVLGDLVRLSREGSEGAPPNHDTVLSDLNELGTHEEEEAIDFQPLTLSLDLSGASAAADLPDLESFATDEFEPGYAIEFTPHFDLYSSGNEPRLILRALAKLGNLQTRLDYHKVTSLSQWEEDVSHLRWSLRLTTDAPRQEVDEIFEFVADLCDLSITPLEESRPAKTDVPTFPEVPTDTQSKQSEMDQEANPDTPKKANAANSTVRVDLEKVDRLMNLVGELVINQAMLSQSVERAGVLNNPDVSQGLEELMQLTRDIQDNVMTVRAQPVKPLFQRMGRIVREASAATGKAVRLKTVGDMTEVDKTVIERLADPLTHMVRNSVDHGLESEETRRSAGKPDEGTITLSAAHQSGRVVIQISDDGGGINREKVRQKAVEVGLISPDQTLPDNEIDELILAPGFSTAGEVSQLSGRGVGLDVVKTAIQSLGGRITIESKLGIGCTFVISLPLTLALLDGMVVEVAGETLVMPLGAIEETMILTAETVRSIRPGSHVVDLRGILAPMVDLGVVLGYREPLDEYCGAIVLVVALEDTTRLAVVVDNIVDQRQVVIKGLQSCGPPIPGIAAATILGDGSIALILDPHSLSGMNYTAMRPDLALKQAS